MITPSQYKQEEDRIEDRVAQVEEVIVTETARILENVNEATQ